MTIYIRDINSNGKLITKKIEEHFSEVLLLV